MKTYVTFVNGYQEVENMNEAIEIARNNDMTNFIVEIDETKLPKDVRAEDAIYAAEDEAITRTTSW